MIRRGKGLACMFYPIGFTEYPNPSAAFMKVEVDGSAVLLTGATDIGQGSTTALCQIASESTGIPVDRIKMITADSQRTPYDTGSVASRVTFVAGNAVKRAADGCRTVLFKAAAAMMGLIVGDPISIMKVENGRICLKGYEAKSVSIAEAAFFSCLRMGVPVTGMGIFNPVTTTLDKNGQGKPYGAHVFATQIAIVDVDDETGGYEIKKIYAVHDCGKVLNQTLIKGQIDGGVGMGVGFGCMEGLIYKDGKVVNNQFTNYIVPSAMDVPDIVSDTIERYDPNGVYGAKGIAEPSLLPTAAAIVNAIHDAVGVLITDLPATPEKVFMAMQAKKALGALQEQELETV